MPSSPRLLCCFIARNFLRRRRRRSATQQQQQQQQRLRLQTSPSAPLPRSSSPWSSPRFIDSRFACRGGRVRPAPTPYSVAEPAGGIRRHCKLSVTPTMTLKLSLRRLPAVRRRSTLFALTSPQVTSLVAAHYFRLSGADDTRHRHGA